MKLLLAIFLAVAFASGNEVEEWAQYKRQFKKDYSNDGEEDRRMNIFFNNKRKIEEHNYKYVKGLVSFKVKINHLSDMETNEVNFILKGLKKPKIQVNGGSKPFVAFTGSVPDSVDWKQKGAVTAVKDQGQCASSGAFSAVASIEGQNFIKTNKLISLSEQNIEDCCFNFNQGHAGCNAGFAQQAFECLQKYGGIDTEDSYPFRDGFNSTCHYNSTNKGATVTGYVKLPIGDEDLLKQAVANIGPISVLIDASNWSFQMYSGGIYDEPACSSWMLDHEVVIVGYGSENGQDFWLIKNSWGTSWGEAGYAKMSRNKNNQCGIATMASYPTV